MTLRSLSRLSQRAPSRSNPLWGSHSCPGISLGTGTKRRTLKKERRSNETRSKETPSCLSISTMITTRTRTFRLLKSKSHSSMHRRGLRTWKHMLLTKALSLIVGNQMRLSRNPLNPRIWLICLRISILQQVRQLDSPLVHPLPKPIREIKNQTLISKIQPLISKVSNLPPSSSSWRSKLWSCKASRLRPLRGKFLKRSWCRPLTPPRSCSLINIQLKTWKISNLRSSIPLVKQFKFLLTLTKWFRSVPSTTRRINLYQNICINWTPRTTSSCRLNSPRKFARPAASLTSQSLSQTFFKEIDSS